MIRRGEHIDRTFPWLTAGLLALVVGCGGGDDGQPAPDAETVPDGVDAGDQRDGGPDTVDATVPGDGNGTGRDVGKLGCDSPTELTDNDVHSGVTLGPGCYRTSEPLGVFDGPLVLRAGTTMLFGPETRLLIRDEGSLRSEGTAEEPVVLRGTKRRRGHWDGLLFRGSFGQASRLSQTVVADAGRRAPEADYPTHGCVTMSSRAEVTLEAVSLHRCEATGLHVPDRDVAFEMRNSQITDSATPVWIHSPSVEMLSGTNAYEDNDDNRIQVASSSLKRFRHTEPASWPNPGIPLFVRVDLYFGAALELAKGTRLEFAAGRALELGGDAPLTAVGSEEEPIVLTGATSEPGFWTGLRLTGSPSDSHLLDNVVVADAGAQPSSFGIGSEVPAGLYASDTPVTIRNTRFESNASTAMVVEGSRGGLEMEASSFVDNELPLRLPAGDVGSIGPETVFEGNQTPYLMVDEGSVDDEQAWRAFTPPYRVTGPIDVVAPLSLAPGVRVEFERDVGMTVSGDGQLVADGSDGESITLTGVEHQQGYWQGIWFNASNSTANTIADTDVSYAGSSEWPGRGRGTQAAIFAVRTRPLHIRDARLNYSGRHGLSVGDGASIEGCENLVFEANAGQDTFFTPSAEAGPGCEALREAAR